MSLNEIQSDLLLWSERIEAGAHWSQTLRRGSSLRLTAEQAGANASILFYNLENPSERYNMADTLKGQHTAHLTAGNICVSDMGRVMCSISADTLGWHDPIGILSTAASLRAQYGEKRYQQAHNDYHRNGHDSMINELEKYRLGLRDLVQPLNLFSKVQVDGDGNMAFVANHAQAGDSVELRFEMDCLVLISTAPHGLDAAAEYAPSAQTLQVWKSGPAPADDPCRAHCDENGRAFINTERYYNLKVVA